MSYNSQEGDKMEWWKMVGMALLLAVAMGAVGAYERWVTGTGEGQAVRRQIKEGLEQMREGKRRLEEEWERIWERVGGEMRDKVRKWRQKEQRCCDSNDVLVDKIHILNILMMEGSRHTPSVLNHTVTALLNSIFSQLGLNISLSLPSPTPPPPGSPLLLVTALPLSALEQNIAARIRIGQFSDSIDTIYSHLASLPHLQHAHHTHLPSLQTNIVLVGGEGEEGYWKVEDGQGYILNSPNSAQGLYNVLLDVYGVKELVELGGQEMRKIYAITRRQCRLERSFKMLEYLEYAYRPSNFSLSHLVHILRTHPQSAVSYLLNGHFLSPYLHTAQSTHLTQSLLGTLLSPTATLLSDPFTDSRLAPIDLLPNDFKLGVYLPLCVIVVFPLLLLLKHIAVRLLTRP